MLLSVLYSRVMLYCFYLVDKGNLMVGSYGPKTDPHTFTTPVEDAPSGLIQRGSYNITSKFTDDDKNIYLEWQWVLQVKKDWD